jgi:hypothetical protein
VEFWAEAMRVAKPGAHLLAFGGTRTYHRLACAIEDAGWEIRDCVMWVYGSGFPKSHDVSKAIDKVNGEGDRLYKFTAWMRTTGLTARQLDEITGTNMGGHYLTAKSQPAIPTAALWAVIRPHVTDVPEWVDELVARIEAEREVVGHKEMADTTKARAGFLGTAHSPDYDGSKRTVPITAPATDAARQWSGWGTALKPAWEPIIVARKPLVGTVAENVLRHGTGAINVDGCRVGTESIETHSRGKTEAHGKRPGEKTVEESGRKTPQNRAEFVGNPRIGRWPANLIHDGSDEVVGLFPSNVKGGTWNRTAGARHFNNDGEPTDYQTSGSDSSSGSAARFFYCAKASKADRDEGREGLEERAHQSGMGGAMPVDDDGKERDRFKAVSRNHHPTVKPTALMRYLCRLVTPPGGIVLDPFTGSGSTGKGAVLEGFRFIGIEREAEYVEIAKARIGAVAAPAPGTLF